MRLIIFFILLSLGAEGQITRCNSFYVPMSTPSLFLDLYPSATVSYSLRKLRTAYAGSCLRVRRSSDNTEQNIGFANNYLDTVSMKNFVGANSGYIVTWYDQSLNGLNVTQATAASQPRIINAGAIDYQANKVSIYFGGANKLSITGVSSTTYPITDGNWACFTIGSVTTSTGTKQFASSDVATGLTRQPQWSRISTLAPQTISFNGGTAATDGNTNISINTLYLFSSFKYPSFTEIFTNNASNGATSSGAQNISTTYFIDLGVGPGGNTNYLNGYLTEFIIYPTNKISDRTNINTAINSFYSLY